MTVDVLERHIHAMCSWIDGHCMGVRRADRAHGAQGPAVERIYRSARAKRPASSSSTSVSRSRDEAVA